MCIAIMMQENNSPSDFASHQRRHQDPEWHVNAEDEIFKLPLDSGHHGCDHVQLCLQVSENSCSREQVRGMVLNMSNYAFKSQKTFVLDSKWEAVSDHATSEGGMWHLGVLQRLILSSHWLHACSLLSTSNHVALDPLLLDCLTLLHLCQPHWQSCHTSAYGSNHHIPTLLLLRQQR